MTKKPSTWFKDPPSRKKDAHIFFKKIERMSRIFSENVVNVTYIYVHVKKMQAVAICAILKNTYLPRYV